MHSLRKLKANAPHAGYHVARGGFRSGDIFAQSHGDWSNWKSIKVLGVRLFTLSSYSHVCVI